MSDRANGANGHLGPDQQGAAGPELRSGEENTSVFATEPAREATQVERAGAPAGPSAPPSWQRSGAPSGGPGGPGQPERSGSVATVADQRHEPVAAHLPYVPQPNGSQVQNPFMAGAKQQAAADGPASMSHGGGGPHGPGPGGPMGGRGGPPSPPSGHGGPGGPGLGGPGPGGPGLGGPGLGAAGLGAAGLGSVAQRQPPAAPGRPSARPSNPLRGRTPRAPRKASLQIQRFDPWSVLKLSLVLSVAMFLMWLVSVGVLYGVLDGMGVWDKVNGAYSDLASVNEDGGGEELISAGRVFGVSAVVGAVNIVLFTAFATVLAFVYNVSADLAGGIEITLSERD